MRKVVIHRPGGYDRLRLETHPDPAPAEGEVLVDVRASGINFADIAVRMGLYESAKEYVGWPITPGFEFAGEVLESPADHPLRPGTRVFGVTRFGAYASRVSVPGHLLHAVPESLTTEEAAGFPAVHLTAYHALFQLFHLRKGMNVLVHSAAGGVGTALLQLLKIAGCRAVGVVGRTEKVETARTFGAAEVIDKSREDLWARARELSPGGYDVILDANGPATLKESYAHLAPMGKLVVYGFHTLFDRRGGSPNYLKLAREWFRIPRFNPLDLVTRNKSVLGFNLSFLFDHEELFSEAMNYLIRWIGEGKLKPPKVTPYPFEEVAKAQRDLESGLTTGKLVLTHHD